MLYKIFNDTGNTVQGDPHFECVKSEDSELCLLTDDNKLFCIISRTQCNPSFKNPKSFSHHLNINVHAF